MYHLEQSEAHISEMEVFAFFKKHLLHWFEAMEIIHKLQSLERVNTCSVSIANMTNKYKTEHEL